MKKKLKITAINILLMIALFSCGDKHSESQKLNTKNSEEVKTEEKVEAEPVKISLTKKQAIDKLKEYIKKSSNSILGSIEEIKTVGGDYNEDGVSDYFYLVSANEGGDYLSFYHYFYNSTKEKITELTYNGKPESLLNLTASNIQKGKITGKALLVYRLTYDTDFSKELIGDFIIKGNKFVIDNANISKFIKADKKLSDEMSKAELLMQENADAYNSEAETEGDY
jgi:hypothetical protein